MKYLYDSNFDIETMKEGISLAQKKGIEIIDTAGLDENKKWKFYTSVFLPISVRYHRRLKGRIRTHKAGYIHFTGVLVTDDNFYIGTEAIKKIKEL